MPSFINKGNYLLIYMRNDNDRMLIFYHMRMGQQKKQFANAIAAHILRHYQQNFMVDDGIISINFLVVLSF